MYIYLIYVHIYITYIYIYIYLYIFASAIKFEVTRSLENFTLKMPLGMLEFSKMDGYL